jgi:hypothetical protein
MSDLIISLDGWEIDFNAPRRIKDKTHILARTTSYLHGHPGVDQWHWVALSSLKNRLKQDGFDFPQYITDYLEETRRQRNNATKAGWEADWDSLDTVQQHTSVKVRNLKSDQPSARKWHSVRLDRVMRLPGVGISPEIDKRIQDYLKGREAAKVVWEVDWNQTKTWLNGRPIKRQVIGLNRSSHIAEARIPHWVGVGVLKRLGIAPPKYIQEQWKRTKPRPKATMRGVYFIQRGKDGLIKIGQGNVLSRLKALQTAHIDNLRIIGVIPLTRKKRRDRERSLLMRFAHLNEGGEWLRPAPELLEFIKLNVTPFEQPIPSEDRPLEQAISVLDEGRARRLLYSCFIIPFLRRTESKILQREQIYTLGLGDGFPTRCRV